MNINAYSHFASSPARKPRGRRVPLSPCSPADDQGGRARVWLFNNVGLASIAVGWALSFLFFFVPMSGDSAFMIAVIAVAFMAFGIGWNFRDERE